MNYGKAFRIIRAAFNLEQGELARVLGIGQSHVSLIESSRRQPSREVLSKLSDSLRIPEPLIALLASEPDSLGSSPDIEGLSQALLRLLVSASDLPTQRPLVYPDKPKEEKG